MSVPVHWREALPVSRIDVVETRYADPTSWGRYFMGQIVTHDAERVRRNIDNLGIDRTGEIRLMPGKVEIP